MSALVLLLLALPALDGGASLLPAPPPRHLGGSRCSVCHVTSSWAEHRFDHAKTGFLLRGRHQQASCGACHPGDFAAPVPKSCNGCHRDVHAGELGARCEGCHDETDFRSRFDAETHRLANFPLRGAHAALPCVECHAESRERRFTRATVECVGCHEISLQATRGGVDHFARGFDQRPCRECHAATSFKLASFREHDTCFPLAGGPHAQLRCLSCHTSLSQASAPGTCSTKTAACASCHQHRCSTTGEATPTDRQHANVPGYQCQSSACTACHATPGGAR